MTMFKVVLPNSNIFSAVYAIPWTAFTKYLSKYLIFAKKRLHKDKQLLHVSWDEIKGYKSAINALSL